MVLCCLRLFLYILDVKNWSPPSMTESSLACKNSADEHFYKKLCSADVLNSDAANMLANAGRMR
jgi:hypothetical protein